MMPPVFRVGEGQAAKYRADHLDWHNLGRRRRDWGQPARATQEGS
jgi:hypothetical protein